MNDIKKINNKICKNKNIINIKISKRAIKHIQTVLKKKKEKFIHIKLKKSGCSGYKYILKFTNDKKKKDFIFQKYNIIFTISQKNIEWIKNLKIDLIQKGLNTQFIFNHKKIKNFCGCGESFDLK